MPKYTVKSGDSFFRIAGRVLGNQRFFEAIMAANPGVTNLRAGQTITIPNVDTSKADRDIVVSQGGIARAAQIGGVLKAAGSEDPFGRFDPNKLSPRFFDQFGGDPASLAARLGIEGDFAGSTTQGPGTPTVASALQGAGAPSLLHRQEQGLGSLAPPRVGGSVPEQQLAAGLTQQAGAFAPGEARRFQQGFQAGVPSGRTGDRRSVAGGLGLPGSPRQSEASPFGVALEGIRDRTLASLRHRFSFGQDPELTSTEALKFGKTFPPSQAAVAGLAPGEAQRFDQFGGQGPEAGGPLETEAGLSDERQAQANIVTELNVEANRIMALFSSGTSPSSLSIPFDVANRIASSDDWIANGFIQDPETGAWLDASAGEGEGIFGSSSTAGSFEFPDYIPLYSGEILSQNSGTGFNRRSAFGGFGGSRPVPRPTFGSGAASLVNWRIGF